VSLPDDGCFTVSLPDDGFSRKTSYALN